MISLKVIVQDISCGKNSKLTKDEPALSKQRMIEGFNVALASAMHRLHGTVLRCYANFTVRAAHTHNKIQLGIHLCLYLTEECRERVEYDAQKRSYSGPRTLLLYV